MRTVRFAALDASVAALGYGSWALGGVFGHVNRDTAIRSLMTYLELGGNFIDTARDYGPAEELIATALRQWKGAVPMIASKVASLGPQRRWGYPVAINEVFPPGQVRKSVENSLRALRLDHLSLAQLHLYWPTWGVDGYWLDELTSLRDAGLIEAIGISVPDYRHESALPLVMADAVDSVQTIVNLFDPTALECLAPIAFEKGVAIIARGVLDEGGLTDRFQQTDRYEVGDIRGQYFKAVDRDEYTRRTHPLKELIPSVAESLAALAIKAVSEHPMVTTAVVSMATPELVEANMRTLESPALAQDLRERLLTRHRWVRNFFEDLYWAEEQAGLGPGG